MLPGGGEKQSRPAHTWEHSGTFSFSQLVLVQELEMQVPTEVPSPSSPAGFEVEAELICQTLNI